MRKASTEGKINL